VVLPRTADPAKPSPEQQLRLEWAANLRDEIGVKNLSAKQFHHLLTEAGAKVTQQAVYGWLAGNTAPSAINQAYVAHVLNAPPHRLFPLPEVQS
jgi:hypothetical protein